jgi:hypothetical protein
VSGCFVVGMAGMGLWMRFGDRRGDDERRGDDSRI